ncbi:MAG: Gfo/Idh/MocA family oxidoreductase [Acidobacteria bacterium]|nr:Gfo/Idh/MocA family oxidoreductase [Acidobacteriota bacterium]
MKEGSVRVAIFGAGGAGRAHSRRFARHGGARVVCYFDPKHQGDIEGIPVRKVIEEIWPEVDAVSVCTPDDTHADYAAQALDAGKAVLIEKPMVGSVSQLPRLEAARARHPAAVLAVHHQMRFVPAFAAAIRRVHSGELGPIGYVAANYWHDMRSRARQFDDWRLTGKGQSVLFGAACHPVDLILHLLDEEPVEVSACAGKLLYPEYAGAYTLVQATLRFPCGAIGSIHANNCARFPQFNDLVILGERGSLCDNLRYIPGEGFQLLKGDMVDRHATAGAGTVLNLFKRLLVRRHELRRPPFSVYDHEAACSRIIDNFINACRGQEAVLVPFDEAARVVRVCEAAERSLRLNRPVRLDER